MTRIIEPANRRGARGAPTVGGAVVDARTVLEGRFPSEGLVVVGERARPDLLAAHDGSENLVVVDAACAEVSVGQVGALVGHDRDVVVHATALRSALRSGPASLLELRWALWNDGAVVDCVGTSRPAPLPSGPLDVDRVPHPDVRSDEISQATVPTLSIVVHGGSDLSCLGDLPGTVRPPTEVLVVGGGEPTGPLPVGHLRHVADVDAAVEEARGAIVWFVHHSARPDREAWARCWRRLQDTRVEVARSALQVAGGPVRSERAMLLADHDLGAPAFAAVRRRVLRKERGDMLAVWSAAVARERSAVVVSHPVPVVASMPAAPIPDTSALVGLTRAEVRAVVGDLRSRTRPGVGSTEQSVRPSVGWVGFSGHANFGDELVLRAARELLAGVDVVPGGEGTHGTVLGGGTLLNARRFYQRAAADIDVPGLQRLVLGTGVVSPALDGWTEDLDGWRPFLEAGPVGLRGPHSLEHLRRWGFDGPAEVLGDPALAIRPEAPARPGLVVLAPVGASAVGQVVDRDEQLQVELLVATARLLAAEGREVSVLSCHPGDDRVALALLRALGDRLEVVYAYRDIDQGVAHLASADLVVGTRLHALVTAAAASTPFVGLAYLPKVADFAASVGAEELVRPIPAWNAEEVVEVAVRAEGAESRERIEAAVEGYRQALVERADEYRHRL